MPNQPDSTLPTLTEAARAHRLYGHDRGDGWIDLYESTVEVPAGRGDLVLVSRCQADTLRLPDWTTWSIGTPGWYLVVEGLDGRDSAIERVVDEASADEGGEPDARHGRLVALDGHVAEVLDLCGRIDSTIALLPETDQAWLRSAAAILRDVADVLDDEITQLAARR